MERYILPQISLPCLPQWVLSKIDYTLCLRGWNTSASPRLNRKTSPTSSALFVRGKGGIISECLGPCLMMSHHLHLSILLGNIWLIRNWINTLIDSALVLLNAWQEASMLSLLLKKILRHEPYWKIRSVPFFRTYWADSLLLGPYHETIVGNRVKDRRKLCPTNLRKTSSVSIKPFETWVVTTV